MFGFIACEQHECNDYDHSADIVGTWTCLREDFAEALVIKADGPANKENDMLIQTFNEDGSSVMTGDADELLVNDKETVSCVTFRMNYSANVTALVSGNPYLPVLLQLAPQDR